MLHGGGRLHAAAAAAIPVCVDVYKPVCVYVTYMYVRVLCASCVCSNMRALVCVSLCDHGILGVCTTHVF
jgi:hypothetical protein